MAAQERRVAVRVIVAALMVTCLAAYRGAQRARDHELIDEVRAQGPPQWRALPDALDEVNQSEELTALKDAAPNGSDLFGVVSITVRCLLNGDGATFRTTMEQRGAELAPWARAALDSEAESPRYEQTQRRTGLSTAELFDFVWNRARERGCEWRSIDLASVKCGTGHVMAPRGRDEVLVGKECSFRFPGFEEARSKANAGRADVRWVDMTVSGDERLTVRLRVSFVLSPQNQAWYPIRLDLVFPRTDRLPVPAL